MAEAFVRTIKRDYVRVSSRPNAEFVMRQLPSWIAQRRDALSASSTGPFRKGRLCKRKRKPGFRASTALVVTGGIELITLLAKTQQDCVASLKSRYLGLGWVVFLPRSAFAHAPSATPA